MSVNKDNKSFKSDVKCHDSKTYLKCSSIPFIPFGALTASHPLALSADVTKVSQGAGLEGLGRTLGLGHGSQNGAGS